jgi:hypothetical protein
VVGAAVVVVVDGVTAGGADVVVGGIVVVVVVSGLFAWIGRMTGSTALAVGSSGWELNDITIIVIVPRQIARISHLPKPLDCFEAYATDTASPIAAIHPVLSTTKGMVAGKESEPCHPATVAAPDQVRGGRQMVLPLAPLSNYRWLELLPLMG